MKLSRSFKGYRLFKSRPLWMLGCAAASVGAAPGWAQNEAGDDPYARGLSWAREVAVPEAQRPRRFVIADFVLGPGTADATALDNGLQMMALLGMNTVDAKGFGDLQSSIPDRAKRFGLNRILRAVYAPLNGVVKEKAYFGWNSEALSNGRTQSWAQSEAALVKGINRRNEEVALFHLADEPGWYFPNVGAEMVSNPARLEMFRAYLRSKGLQPNDVGQGSWATVFPVGASAANDVASRRLFYWSVRYPTESAARTMRLWSDAVHQQFGPQAQTTANWNNLLSRWYFPSPNQKWGKNTDAGPDAALGSFDWMEAGRNRAVSTLWSEDWLNDNDAQYWSFIADGLKSAAREGEAPGYQPEFGGYVVGRRLSGHAAGGKYKALSLIGHGAKTLEWYVWGPEGKFKGNGYSENRNAYREIADANRLIGRAESLLFPGRPQRSRIAILMPTSAPAWDASPLAPLYQHEMKGLHFALMHAGYAVDFLDETNLAKGDLTSRNYNLIYITAPNVSVAAQNGLRDWINKGGTAVFSPGAAGADEYNTPTSILDATRGVRSQVLPRATVADEVRQITPIAFRDAAWGSDANVIRAVAGLNVTDATTVATANGTPAMAYRVAGQGLAVSYGFWPGASYFDSPRRGDVTRLPINWNDALRAIVVAGPRVTKIRKSVEVGTPEVEAARLDSDAGIAVTLLNWTDVPLENLAVTIRNAGAIQSVGSAERGAIPFTREGDSIRLSLPLRDVDVLMLRR